jgi:hypothetical protein
MGVLGSSNTAAVCLLVWGTYEASHLAPLGEVVRRCLELAIFRTRQYLLGSLILLL